MAETVKKSRIVSEEEKNLEETLLEEFNMRLKNCMSNDNLRTADEEPEREEEKYSYEDVHHHNNHYDYDKPISKVALASHELINSERQSYYDYPVPLKNGAANAEGEEEEAVEQQNGHHDENIYETLPERGAQEKTESDQYVDMSAHNLTLDISPKIEIEHVCYEDCNVHSLTGSDMLDTSYEMVEHEDTVVTVEVPKSVKDRMFLATDDAAATLLFTQTVTSPMLTPSEENIDFLKGFQRENPNSDTTATSSESPPKEEFGSAENSSTSEHISNAVLEEAKEEEEVIYENAEFLKHHSENIYENLKETDIYENEEVLDEPEEHIYQDIDESPKEDHYENIDELRAPKPQDKEEMEVMVENSLYDVQPEELCTDLDFAPPDTEEKHYEEIEKTESYSEFVHHSKTESNYYEKYSEVVSQTVEITNREKDTETVPPEIVKNLKNQFSKTSGGGVEVVGATKKEVGDVNDLRTIDIANKINKFEVRDAGDTTGLDLDDSTVTECYTETTTIQSAEIQGEKSLKKKKTKKSRKEEKENISVKSSFNKFDALQKKNVLHVRSSDSVKAQEKFNGTQQVDTTNCKACSKQVFQMEQVKAEKAIWHKNCFRCTECSKQLTVETYASHEGSLYCKPHFKSLFAPKAVEDETPPSDKPDLGLEELQSLNVKERFQVFENHQTEIQESDRGPTPVNVKRSPSILSKLARFQAKGMDVGVPDDALDGIPIEESSSEEEEMEEKVPEGEDPTLFKAKKVQREKPFHFTNLTEVKNKWEHGEQNSKDERREERKQELQSIRNKIFLGKQGKMKEAYQQAVMQSESCANIHKPEKIESYDTKSLKERFEKGQLYNERETSKSGDEDETEVFQSEISKKSRTLFLELDANASKPPQLSPPAPPKTEVKKAREAYVTKTTSDDTVKASEAVEDMIEVKTADIQQRFRFFETYKEPEKERKQFRITPPRDPSQVKTDTPEREIYHDPDVVRAEDYIDDSVIAKTTHTASKMLNKFRQMEENLAKEPEPAGPKPLKRFTPPPEPARPESTSGEEESEEEEEEEVDEDQTNNQKIPEDLLEAQKAARAKQLRAKFEKWEAQEIRREQNQSVNIVEEYGEESQIESTKTLRARFEQMRDASVDKTKSPRVKVNRFVEIANITEVCGSCLSRVYPLEKISVHGHVYHKSCFKCMECSCLLRMDSYSYNQGRLYCRTHFKRLFISKGNYDSAFGLDQRKKWSMNATIA